MKTFLKENAPFIKRLLLNQFGLTIFGIMTVMTAAAIDNAMSGEGTVQRTCMFWVSVFTIVFYMFVDYAAIKEEGQRDKIRVDAGRIARDPWRGLKIALCASMPCFILGLLSLIFGLLGAENGLALEWAGSACGITKLIALVIQAMYWGVLLVSTGVATIAEIPAFCYLIIPLPAFVCVTVAYLAGLHDISLIRRVKDLLTPEKR